MNREKLLKTTVPEN
jgi:hypothetical protein